MNASKLKKYIWHLQSYRKGGTATVVWYPWLLDYEVNTRSERLFKRLYRHLPTKPKNYESFKQKMAARNLYAILNLRVNSFKIIQPQ